MDKYDKRAVELGLKIGNAVLDDKPSAFMEKFIAQALRECAAEAFEEAAMLSPGLGKASALRHRLNQKAIAVREGMGFPTRIGHTGTTEDGPCDCGCGGRF